MQSAKLLVLLVSLLWFQHPTHQPEVLLSDYLWYPGDIQALKRLCRCDVKLHPDYEALPVSLTGDAFLSFLMSEQACGVLNVNETQTKGSLFVSSECMLLRSLPGIRRIEDIKPDSRDGLYAFWSY